MLSPLRSRPSPDTDRRFARTLVPTVGVWGVTQQAQPKTAQQAQPPNKTKPDVDASLSKLSRDTERSRNIEASDGRRSRKYPGPAPARSAAPM